MTTATLATTLLAIERQQLQQQQDHQQRRLYGYAYDNNNNSNSHNTSHDDDDDDDYDAETTYIMVMLALFCVVGLVGNALVLYVFGRRKDRLVSTLFIVSLAVIDFVTCLVIIPFTMYVEYVERYVSSDAVCKLYSFLVTANIPFSAMIMAAIAVDRYFAICRPLLQVSFNNFRQRSTFRHNPFNVDYRATVTALSNV